MRITTKELLEKTIAGLQKEADEIREELARLALSSRVNPPKDTNMLGKKRKKLAVVLTILKQKKDLELLNKKQ